MFNGIGKTLLAGLVGLWLAQPLMAEELAKPQGEVVLTVGGAITARNAGEMAEFDVEMLRAMGEVTFETTTPWTEGKQAFTGVPLNKLMAALGVSGGHIKATAVNDYAIDIPVSDGVDGGPILAYLQNGNPMSLREKGPLWVVYPYDQNREYQSEVIYSRSIWQLVRLDILPE